MSANIRHSSATTEHYTPSEIIGPSLAVMGGIDLDPASCEAANELVGADQFYGIEENGYTYPWFGRIFLNPPGGKMDVDGVPLVRVPRTDGSGYDMLRATDGKKPGKQVSAQRAWWFKLVHEYAQGHIQQAIFVAFSLELLQVTQNIEPYRLPIPLDFPMCIPRRRVDYLRDKGDGLRPGGAPPHASAIIYLPPREPGCRPSRGVPFYREFSDLGRVVLNYWADFESIAAE